MYRRKRTRMLADMRRVRGPGLPAPWSNKSSSLSEPVADFILLTKVRQQVVCEVRGGVRAAELLLVLQAGTLCLEVVAQGQQLRAHARKQSM